MIYLDAGNSFIKLASHAGDITGDDVGLHQDTSQSWIVHLRARHADVQKVVSLLNTELFSEMPVTGCSVVDSLTNQFQDILGSRMQFVHRGMIDRAQLDYQTPESLGMDRFLACLGAAWLSRGEDVVVIDAGTATTIDVMSADGVFRGGVIMPGINLMERGLNEYAPALPEVTRELPFQWPPKSTKEALQWGITGSYLEAVKAHINRLRKDKSRVWITGGDADVLAQIREFELNYHPNLVFEGLRAWIKSSRG
jgi:type III pantothenate kinase